MGKKCRHCKAPLQVMLESSTSWVTAKATHFTPAASSRSTWETQLRHQPGAGRPARDLARPGLTLWPWRRRSRPPLSAQTRSSCGLEVTTASKSECVLVPRAKHPAINYLRPHGVSRLLWGPRVRGQTGWGEGLPWRAQLCAEPPRVGPSTGGRDHAGTTPVGGPRSCPHCVVLVTAALTNPPTLGVLSDLIGNCFSTHKMEVVKSA